MADFNIKELEKIISDGGFDALKGKVENDFFECKGQIYTLADDASKRELAKDISSFANLNGGYILIGPKTEKSEDHFADIVTSVSLLDKSLVNEGQYYDILKEWVYPEVDVKIEWKHSKSDCNKGIVIIHIPPQRDDSKPFLIKKLVEGGKTSEVIFGYTERKRDKSNPKQVLDIHKIMKDGLHYDKNISNRFDNLESLISKTAKTGQHQKQVTEDDIIRRMEDMFRAGAWNR